MDERVTARTLGVEGGDRELGFADRIRIVGVERNQGAAAAVEMPRMTLQTEQRLILGEQLIVR